MFPAFEILPVGKIDTDPLTSVSGLAILVSAPKEFRIIKPTSTLFLSKVSRSATITYNLSGGLSSYGASYTLRYIHSAASIHGDPTPFFPMSEALGVSDPYGAQLGLTWGLRLNNQESNPLNK
ncbi:hypothetical protein IMZ48_02420 [Candidatus Bathyarchaeota archaeon]|nr:hypothetical protein [Candidatus Bathyarchaeota archaeon]